MLKVYLLTRSLTLAVFRLSLLD